MFSVTFYSLSLSSYILLFNSRKNTISVDYNPFIRAKLDFSFYLIIAAIGTLFMPITLMILSKTRRIKKSDLPVSVDRTVFLY